MLKKILSNLPILTIIIISAFLRLYRIADYMTFLGDEGRDVLVAYNILHGHFTLLGPTASVGGFFFGPLYYYMMAPFLFLFNYNPVGPAVMIALFGIATVWLVYRLGEILFSKPIGILSALLYATSPLVIAYSRSSWNPNPVPFFAFLLILLLYKAVQQFTKYDTSKTSGRQQDHLFFHNTLYGKWQLVYFCIGVLWGILVELHFVTGILALVIFPYLLITFFIFEKKNRWVYFLVIPTSLIIVGFVVGMLPYLGFEVRHNFPNIRSFVQFMFFSGKVTASGNGLLTLGNVLLRLFGRILMNADPIERVTKITQGLVIEYIFPAIIATFSIVLLLIQLFIAWNNKQTDNFKKILLITCWFIGGVFVFAFYHKPIYDYYFGFMYAVPFLLAANLVIFFFKKGLLFKGVGVGLVGWLLFINIQGIPFRYGPNRQLNQTEVIAKEVLKMTDNKPYNFALITGGNSDHAYRYFLTLWGHPPVTIENNVIDPQRKTVTKQLIVVCESLPCSPLGVSLWEVAGFGRADIAEKKHVIVVDIYKLIHYKGK